VLSDASGGQSRAPGTQPCTPAVQAYTCGSRHGGGPHLPPRALSQGGIEDRAWLDQAVLRSSRSHLPQALIAHGEHRTYRCSGWAEDLLLNRGYAPEVA